MCHSSPWHALPLRNREAFVSVVHSTGQAEEHGQGWGFKPWCLVVWKLPSIWWAVSPHPWDSDAENLNTSEGKAFFPGPILPRVAVFSFLSDCLLAFSERYLVHLIFYSRASVKFNSSAGELWLRWKKKSSGSFCALCLLGRRLASRPFTQRLRDDRVFFVGRNVFCRNQLSGGLI